MNEKMQSLKLSLNLQLNNQKHNIYIFLLKINLKVIKPAAQQRFGDMLAFYTFIIKFGAVRYVDVCVHTHTRREIARKCFTPTHARSLSVQHSSGKVCFLNVMI